jgi:hypothetical protein
MRMIINPEWKKEIEEKLSKLSTIDETISYNKSAQWLICRLSENGTPFKVYNLGAGVKRVTTDTDICPCCKRVL